MFELMLNPSGGTGTPIPNTPPVLLYDPISGTDLISDNITEVVNANTTADSTRLLNGNGTKKYTANGSGATLTLKTPMNMDIPEWTIEYDAVADTFPAGSSYQNDFYMYTSLSGGYIWSIWGDTGWNNQMQTFAGQYVSNSTIDNANTYRFGPLKTDEAGVVRRIAMVLKNGQITVYKNGTRIGLAADLASKGNPTVLSYPKRSVGNLNKIVLGYINANFPSYYGAFGRLAIYNYARYAGASYTVKPIAAVPT